MLRTLILSAGAFALTCALAPAPASACSYGCTETVKVETRYTPLFWNRWQETVPGTTATSLGGGYFVGTKSIKAPKDRWRSAEVEVPCYPDTKGTQSFKGGSNASASSGGNGGGGRRK